jgi:hypothetical protein
VKITNATNKVGLEECCEGLSRTSSVQTLVAPAIKLNRNTFGLEMSP